MKKYIVCVATIAVATFKLAASDSSEVILQAQNDAESDAKSYNSIGWGLGAYGASVLLSPLLGGGGVIIFAYTSAPPEVPIARFAAIQDKYDDASAALMYKSQYQETMARIQHNKNGTAAWIGTGLGVVTWILAIIVVSSL